jgi:hypothetical protein
MSESLRVAHSPRSQVPRLCQTSFPRACGTRHRQRCTRPAHTRRPLSPAQATLCSSTLARQRAQHQLFASGAAAHAPRQLRRRRSAPCPRTLPSQIGAILAPSPRPAAPASSQAHQLYPQREDHPKRGGAAERWGERTPLRSLDSGHRCDRAGARAREWALPAHGRAGHAWRCVTPSERRTKSRGASCQG